MNWISIELGARNVLSPIIV